MANHKPKKPSGHSLVNNEQFEILAMALAAVRKHQDGPTDISTAVRDMSDALEALAISGYVVIPKGLLNALHKALEELF